MSTKVISRKPKGYRRQVADQNQFGNQGGISSGCGGEGGLSWEISRVGSSIHLSLKMHRIGPTDSTAYGF